MPELTQFDSRQPERILKLARELNGKFQTLLGRKSLHVPWTVYGHALTAIINKRGIFMLALNRDEIPSYIGGIPTQKLDMSYLMLIETRVNSDWTTEVLRLVLIPTLEEMPTLELGFIPSPAVTVLHEKEILTYLEDLLTLNK